MTVDDPLRAAVGLLRRNASTVLPYYALLAAAVDVARLPLLVGVLVVYVLLTRTGQLDSLVDDLVALNPELLAPENPTAVSPELSERFATTLLSPTVVGPLLVAVLVGVVCYVLARGVTRAAALAAVDAGLDGHDPLPAGIDGVDRWRTFAGLVVVRWGLLVVAGLPMLVAVVGGVGTFGAGGPLDQEATLAVFAALVGALVTVVSVLVVLALLAFAGPAAVVDDVGIWRAIRRSVGVPVAHPGGFALYVVVVVGSYVLLGVGGVVFAVAGVDRVVALVSTFLVTPLLDGVAVALYAGWVNDRKTETSTSDVDRHGGDDRLHRDAAADDTGFVFGDDRIDHVESVQPIEPVEPESKSPEGAWDDPERVWKKAGFEPTDEVPVRGARGALRDGLRELAEFLRHDWRYVVVAAVVLVAGVVGGWTATAGYGIRIGAPDDPGMVFGAVPVGPFVNIAVNNWLVAASAGFSGVFAGLPTVGTLLFNGLLVGAVAGVVDPLTFVALVGPHGLVELPAIAVAGGVGLRLGHVGWDAWRGVRPRSVLVDEIGRTWRVLVGLAVVFVVAGFVEAFVTPQVAAAVLG